MNSLQCAADVEEFTLMHVEPSPLETRQLVRKHRTAGATIGVVPTMGALHAGHVSLVEAARRECDFVVATIFVNPTQFGPNEDFDKYPRTLEADLAKCQQAGADLVFTPDTSQMYLPDAVTVVQVAEVTQLLEGAVRPTHFDGVTTVVAKLFNITEPDRAYFGQKDYQQQLVIRRMAKDLDFGLEVVTCPIVREHDGLAMSSRNRYLSAEDRQRALVLSQTIFAAENRALAGESPDQIAEEMRRQIEDVDGVQLDYAMLVHPETLQPSEDGCQAAVALVAAKLGQTRLIDNHILQFR